MNQYKIDGVVKGSSIDEKTHSLFLDVRDLHSNKTSIVKLSLPDLDAEVKKGIASQWSQLEGVRSSNLYFVEYLDRQDPTKQRYLQLDWDTGETTVIQESFEWISNTLAYPYIYDHGSDYFKTVMDFLSIDSPLSCEYFEWDDKIIISYYLRSDTKFDRYLILLKEGKKVWKIKQDDGMNGFSSGSFFVFQDQLIFIKDLNEVCIYTG